MWRVLSLVCVAVEATEIIGYDGKEVHTYDPMGRTWQGAKNKKEHVSLSQHHHRSLLNRTSISQSSALKALEKVAGSTVKDEDGVFDAAREVAVKAIAKRDEQKAEEVFEAVTRSLVALRLSSKKPGMAHAAAQMQSEMCVEKMHRKDCQEHMKKFCADHPKNEHCLKLGLPKKKEEAKKPEEQVQTNGDWKYNDMKDYSSDWRSEYGPRVDETYKSACLKHPNNDWCRDRYGAALWMSEPKFSQNKTLLYLIAAAIVGAVIGFLCFYTYVRIARP